MIREEETFEFIRSRHPGMRLTPLQFKRHVAHAHKRWSKLKRQRLAFDKVAAMLQQTLDKENKDNA